ncbi:MAG: ribonuclease HII [Spirochaetota bacterium]|nr:MAG: ribonuclease HII [Spirochaetota bacterium]
MHEDIAERQGYKRIGGIDEAGRGALAGPVVAACVILDPHNIPPGIVDSKKISDRKRRSLYKSIQESSLAVGIGCAPPNLIDEVNIYNATKVAMKLAINDLDCTPDFLLIDAVKLYDISISSLSITKGEEKSVSIAAASIIAKVHRDDIMISMSKKYPEYRFFSHKGYATAYHREALLRYGPISEHRYSYRPVNKAYEQWK